MAWIGPWEVWKVGQLTGLDSSFPFFWGGSHSSDPGVLWSSLTCCKFLVLHRRLLQVEEVALHQPQGGGFASHPASPCGSHISAIMLVIPAFALPRKCGWKYTMKPFQGKCTVSRGQTCGGVVVQN